MTRSSTHALLVFAVSAFAGLVLAANEKPTPEFQNIMKSNGAANGALRAAVAAKDYDAVAKVAATVKDNYVKTEAFFAAKKMDDAVAMSKTGMKAADDMGAAAAAKNDEGIEAATRALAATCGGCHTAHREQLPDKSFEIK